MNEVDIKITIRMYFRPIYDKENPPIEKFNGTLSSTQLETSMNNVHIA